MENVFYFLNNNIGQVTRANVKKTPRFGGHSIPAHASTAK